MTDWTVQRQRLSHPMMISSCEAQQHQVIGISYITLKEIGFPVSFLQLKKTLFFPLTLRNNEKGVKIELMLII